ncbi:MAG: pyridoxal phosphate-dependent aminotransferase [Bacteroidetes bacterium]|jgi:aspartate/methionine/tyrosine aminotransferase|nr:pyridoxal phosphate-dependent aminotransferase [Bacteroidota bacterium]MBT5527595.1 pyridoxal phosphate-dependent aminotransferase [Cytophagia bacterium]MBT3422595.1 pyridoxal phosphate-dependent aminotransferase [Bacteroidota bacterium]MBT3802113.1 pyridoxal phosphate-dependent aminotransferase [Bacteroidota bacterium]MBT3933770.1 pyridoxal phosphate-dependent aminotransferase [Bacteroidota bacterium]
MKNTPINYQIVKQKIEESGVQNIGKASIRELLKVVSQIEKETGEKFIRMEMGVPGLPPAKIGVEAEIEALRKGVASLYPNIEGIPELKAEIVRFVKLFLNIDVDPSGCIPTVGSMLGGFASFMTLGRLYEGKDTTLFIDPGFPVQKQQHHVLGQKYESFDVYNYRGEKLREKLESYLSKGNIVSIIYSNPNNPSWICFTDDELKTIAELADKYNVVVIEDLAYFGMDFRKDYSEPGVPPYQPSVSQYTDNYILLISSSKVFSYAGQRIGMLVVSDKVFNTQSADLRRYFSSDLFGRALIFGSIYALSSGTAHSPQYGLAAILKAVNEGQYKYRKDVLDYAEKAKVMKKYFLDNGFEIVYDTDIDQPIADGFYFTICYPGFSGEELVEELLYYGVSAISLAITGSERLEGLRACVSQVDRNQFADLAFRLKKFKEDHPYNG